MTEYEPGETLPSPCRFHPRDHEASGTLAVVTDVDEGFCWSGPLWKSARAARSGTRQEDRRRGE